METIRPPEPKIYSGVEHGVIEIPLDELISNHAVSSFSDAEERGLYVVRAERGRLVFAATNYVGLIPINDRISIDIRPKLPISNLARLLSISGNTPHTFENLLRGYSVDNEPLPLLLNLFTKALMAALQQVRLHGIFREYVERRDSTSFPRGRILLGQTVQRFAARGVNHTVDYAWFERSLDNGPNQLVKYTVWFLSKHFRSVLRSQSGAKKTLHQLNEAYRLFDTVSLDHSHRFMQHSMVSNPSSLPTIRSYYVPLLNVCKAIITNRSIALESTDTPAFSLPSLLLNLNDIFEAYIRNVLQRELSDRAGLIVTDGKIGGATGARKSLYDSRPSVDATPDVVIGTAESMRSGPKMIIEIKYKRLKDEPSRDDLNQLITYACSYRCDTNVLLYPATAPAYAGLKQLGTIDGRKLYLYSVDLSSDNLPAVEGKLAHDIGALLDA